MSATGRQSVNQYVADICRLASQVEAVSRRDPIDTRSAAVNKALAIHEELMGRRSALKIAPEELGMVEAMLERIKAQLKFLSH